MCPRYVRIVDNLEADDKKCAKICQMNVTSLVYQPLDACFLSNNKDRVRRDIRFCEKVSHFKDVHKGEKEKNTDLILKRI